MLHLFLPELWHQALQWQRWRTTKAKLIQLLEKTSGGPKALVTDVPFVARCTMNLPFKWSLAEWSDKILRAMWYTGSVKYAGCLFGQGHFLTVHANGIAVDSWTRVRSFERQCSYFGRWFWQIRSWKKLHHDGALAGRTMTRLLILHDLYLWQPYDPRPSVTKKSHNMR